MKPYCTQNGDCASCSLSSYGKDCHNKPSTTKDKTLQIRLELDLHDKAKKLAPEGNVSMWIRLLIKKEIEKKESEA